MDQAFLLLEKYHILLSQTFRNNLLLRVAIREAREITGPWLPSLIDDHQCWFNDPRFDGSFPSRVLPFLYLGFFVLNTPRLGSFC